MQKTRGHVLAGAGFAQQQYGRLGMTRDLLQLLFNFTHDRRVAEQRFGIGFNFRKVKAQLDAVKQGGEVRRADGLGEVIEQAVARQFNCLGQLGRARDHDHHAGRIAAQDLWIKLVTGAIRQTVVQNNQIERTLGYLRPRGGDRVAGQYLASRFRRQFGEHPRKSSIIVNQQARKTFAGRIV